MEDGGVQEIQWQVRIYTKRELVTAQMLLVHLSTRFYILDVNLRGMKWGFRPSKEGLSTFLHLVSSWYVTAAPSETSACMDRLSLCLHFTQTDYIRRKQNIRQEDRGRDGGCLENKEQPPLRCTLLFLSPPSAGSHRGKPSCAFCVPVPQ